MLFSDRPTAEWMARYEESHRHPVNRACHTVGIPVVAASVPAGLATLVWWPMWPAFVALFAAGWTLQFVGHAFEGKKPEFFTDWRFLFVGLRWWWKKVHKRA